MFTRFKTNIYSKFFCLLATTAENEWYENGNWDCKYAYYIVLYQDLETSSSQQLSLKNGTALFRKIISII